VSPGDCSDRHPKRACITADRLIRNDFQQRCGKRTNGATFQLSCWPISFSGQASLIFDATQIRDATPPIASSAARILACFSINQSSMAGHCSTSSTLSNCD
jgi:hypothetical protein